METGGTLLEVGAGENITGKITMTGRIRGMEISRTTSFLRVADRISRRTKAAETLLSPIFTSLVLLEKEMVRAK